MSGECLFIQIPAHAAGPGRPASCGTIPKVMGDDLREGPGKEECWSAGGAAIVWRWRGWVGCMLGRLPKEHGFPQSRNFSRKQGGEWG